ncbi:hypothetical protein EDD18DRAFT_1081763, partial [Armillaria luteobubalina]
RKAVCTACNERFNRQNSLRIHVNTHTGTTLPGCGRGFNINYNMHHHYRYHANPPSACLIVAPLAFTYALLVSLSGIPPVRIYQIDISTIIVDYVL